MHRALMLLRLLTDRSCKSQRIHRMDQFRLINDIFYFVSLQMADHMPMDVFGHHLIFSSQFLNLIFTEISLSQRINLLQHLYRFCLTDCNQCHLTAVPAASCTGCVDSFLYLFILTL